MRRPLLLFLSILVSTSAYARIGENIDSLKARLGEPNVEQPEKGVYGWSAKEDDRVFHIVIVDAEGRSVAEQLKAYGGTALDEATVTSFFARQLGHIGFIDRFIDSSSIVFQSVELKFAPGTRVYLDSGQVLLCVWETIPDSSACVYTEKGIKHRTAFRDEEPRKTP